MASDDLALTYVEAETLSASNYLCLPDYMCHPPPD
jgi:hypothetical protein